MQKERTCLVTGGTGFSGSYVVKELLQAGYHVVSFQRSGSNTFFEEMIPKELRPKVDIVQGSVTEPLDLFDAIRKYNVDVIVHLAYLLFPYSEIPPLSLRVNVMGTCNIFEAARLFGLKRVVWSGSIGGFGKLAEFYGGKLVSEKDVVYRPTRLYGASKALLEFLSNQYNQQFGVDIICFRFPRIYGIGQLRGGGGIEIAGLFKQAALDQPVTIRRGASRWSYCYVKDVARAVVTACNVSSTGSKIFNVGTDDVYNGWQLAEVIKKVNSKAQVNVEPGFHDSYDYPALDTSPSKNELGFIPEYPLEKGLREVFNYYRLQNGLKPLI